MLTAIANPSTCSGTAPAGWSRAARKRPVRGSAAAVFRSYAAHGVRRGDQLTAGAPRPAEAAAAAGGERAASSRSTPALHARAARLQLDHGCARATAAGYRRSGSATPATLAGLLGAG
ncbi:hypothetical protein HBB16_16870 [Pseudonocardia sp. MCCB 268]|nr:hypothetical protein [Pseudonocardia cytotoxica]